VLAIGGLHFLFTWDCAMILSVRRTTMLALLDVTEKDPLSGGCAIFAINMGLLLCLWLVPTFGSFGISSLALAL